MSEQIGSALFVALLVLAVWWGPFRRDDTVSTYWISTSTRAQEAEQRFSADRSSNTVVYLMKDPGRDSGTFIPLSECTVLDYKNWWCASGYRAINGDVTGSPFESDPRVRRVSALRYWIAPAPKPNPDAH
jgi:hypothetical protein